MVDLNRLKVSLTKNGYLKIAEVLKRHPRWEVLDNVYGVYRGVNVVRSQASNIMDEEGLSGEVPEHWDEIRSLGSEAIEAFTFVAVILSHGELIARLKASSLGNMKGCLVRSAMGTKMFTNLVYAMAYTGLCDYERGAATVNYDLTGAIYDLRRAGHIVKQLLKSKLRRCGWRDPEVHPQSTDQGFSRRARHLRCTGYLVWAHVHSIFGWKTGCTLPLRRSGRVCALNGTGLGSADRLPEE